MAAGPRGRPPRPQVLGVLVALEVPLDLVALVVLVEVLLLLVVIVALVVPVVLGTSALHAHLFDEQLLDESVRGHSRTSWASLHLLNLLPDPPRPQKPSRNLADTSKEVSKISRNSKGLV